LAIIVWINELRDKNRNIRPLVITLKNWEPLLVIGGPWGVKLTADSG